MPPRSRQATSVPAVSTGGAGTLYLAHVLTHATRVRLDEVLRPLDLSSFQYTILSLLSQSKAVTSSQLSRRFHITPQAMGEVIALLEKKGFIARTEDPGNRRILVLSLTEKGSAAKAEGETIVSGFERDLFRAASDAEIDQFRNTLLLLLNALKTSP